ncbi:MAG TPA: MMPL family transporter [Candidatus Dormibacteraeota bacterium]|nr:MMPL family transporter [Candidatus Dormibacteraeota bacterium]
MNLFGRLARVINRRPWAVVGAAVVLASVAGTFGGSVSKSLQSGGFQDPSSQSSQAVVRLENATGLRSDGGIIALVSTKTGVDSIDSFTEVTRVAGVIAAEGDIDHVLTYYRTHAPSMVSRDRTGTIVVGIWKRISDQEATLAAARLAAALKTDPNVKLGGVASVNDQLNTTITGDLGRAELLAFPILFLLSLWVFRGLVAALLPPLVGGIVILASFLFLRGVTELHPVSIFALNLVTGMGLGLAIDSSLFILSRYREEMAKGAEPSAAIERTLHTAGRSVLFSSLTIAAAMASLTVFPINFLWSMGVGGVIVALTAGLIALTVLPAVLRLLGRRVNSLAPRSWQRGVSEPSETRGFWYRMSWFVMRRPVPVAALSAVVLIALGLPFLGIRFNSVDLTALPSGLAARQVDDALHRDFGVPSGATINVVVEAPASDAAKAQAFADTLKTIANVADVSTPQPVGAGTWTIDVRTPGGNFDPATLTVVHDIRAESAPFTVLVDGQAAQFVDLQSSLASHLPVAIAIVALATVLLLFLMTGSVVLPLKAVVMNLLTLSAAFGVLVLIFQDGRFETLLGFKSQGALESTQPVLLFAIVFGLSTDYGVYLLTRIKEAHDAGLPNSEAVAAGLQRTGRIITAAALLFCVAIGAFATSQIIFIKELGIGIAAGVIVDATVVRGLLVPSLMALLGRWNWWAPRPLRWLYLRAGLSEASPETGPTPGQSGFAR